MRDMDVVAASPPAFTPARDVPESWMAESRCRAMDPEIFFPTDGLGVQRAAAICETCPVREACLDYALRNGIQHGVFGGVSERARVRLRRARAAAAQQEQQLTPER
jgi:WhiB family transcriptional regulator, redox-sensing transcriptional regulator